MDVEELKDALNVIKQLSPDEKIRYEEYMEKSLKSNPIECLRDFLEQEGLKLVI
jgi:hypothetical protein